MKMPSSSSSFAHADGERRVADDDRHDGAMSPSSGLKPAAFNPSRSLSRDRVQALDAARFALQNFDRLHRAGGDGGRQRVGEQLRTRDLLQVVDQRLRSGDIAARRAAERLAQRAGDDVDLAFDAVMLRRAAAVLAHHAGAVGIVENDRGVVTSSRAR